VLFKKRWSDGLHNDFEHVDEFESKFGLFGGDGGDDGGGGGSPDNSYSDMFGSADSYSAAPDNSYSDMFGSVDSYSAAPAAATPSVDTFAEISAISPVDTFAEIGNRAPVASTPSYNPFTVAEEIAAKNQAQQQPGLMPAVSGRQDLSFLSANAIDRALAPSLAPSPVPVTPQAAREQATTSFNKPSFEIAEVPFSVGAVPAVGGIGFTTPAFGGTFGAGVGLAGPTMGYSIPLGGVGSLLRR